MKKYNIQNYIRYKNDVELAIKRLPNLSLNNYKREEVALNKQFLRPEIFSYTKDAGPAVNIGFLSLTSEIKSDIVISAIPGIAGLSPTINIIKKTSKCEKVYPQYIHYCNYIVGIFFSK